MLSLKLYCYYEHASTCPFLHSKLSKESLISIQKKTFNDSINSDDAGNVKQTIQITVSESFGELWAIALSHIYLEWPRLYKNIFMYVGNLRKMAFRWPLNGQEIYAHTTRYSYLCFLINETLCFFSSPSSSTTHIYSVFLFFFTISKKKLPTSLLLSNCSMFIQAFKYTYSERDICRDTSVRICLTFSSHT